ncbi:MAG TPA: ImmA/IrrE family metallo-endopeptidase [Flavobacterium sp.]
MNTTEIGNDFENKVFLLIKELLEKDEFTVPGKRSRIYQKKGYYSENRNSEIITDISIETFLPEATDYSILNIIECKFLNKNVAIDDIEEFDSKLTQIGKHNTKGFIVSNKGFGKTTIKFAKSLKIGLLKIKSNSEFEWINYRKKYEPIDFEKDETEAFLAKAGNKVCNNIADFLIEINAIDFYNQKDKYLTVKYLTADYIKSIVDRILKYDVTNYSALDTKKMIQFINERYSMEIKFERLTPIMGKIEFHPLKIVIDSTLDEHRQRFTLCHEIGHLVLHKKIFENKIERKEDSEYTLSLNNTITDMATRRIEIQANIFASYLLLPSETFLLEVFKFFIQNNISKNYIHLDKQPVNQLLASRLISEMSNKFNTSQEAVRLRLIDTNLLKDTTRFSYRDLLERTKS